MNKEQLENMKVAELKEESRKFGLTLESKGHKFNKNELIERILQAQDVQNDINKAIEEAVAEKKANANCFGFMYEPKRPAKFILTGMEHIII